MTRGARPRMHPVVLSTGLRIVAILLGVLGSVIIARLGGAELKGISAAFAAAVSVSFMFLNLDLAQQTLRRFRASSDYRVVGSFLLRAWFLYSSMGGLCLILLFVYNLPFVWIMLGAVCFTMMSQAGVAAIGLRGVVVGSLGAIIQQLSLIVSVVVFVSIDGLTAESIKICIIISYLSSLCLYAPYVFREGIAAGPVSFRSIGTLVWQGMPWQLGRLCQILMQKLDILAATVLIGAAAAGIYSVGLSMAMLCTLIPAQISNHVLHKTANSGSKGLAVGGQLWATLALGIVPAITLAVFGEWLIEMMYGVEFVESYFLMLACLPGAVAYGLIQVQTNVIRLVGGWKSFVLVGLISVSVMIICLLLLIPKFGAIGAAVSFSVTSIIAVLLGLLLFRHPLRQLKNGSI